MKSKDGVWFNGSSKSRKRRISVINRLEKQLELSMKKKGTQTFSLNIGDITRITKELNILKSRI